MKGKRKVAKLKTIAARDGGCKCAYCQKSLTIKRATLDHVIPRCRGGVNANVNLKIACFHCNQKKAAKSCGNFLREITRAAVA